MAIPGFISSSSIRRVRETHFNLRSSAFACLKAGTTASASFQSARNSRYWLPALATSPESAYARAEPKRASAPRGELPTIPR